MTVIRLLDDTKAYLHAVIDNFSRRILSWRLAERLDPSTTCEILKEAGKNLGLTPTVIADSGVENVNAGVDQRTTPKCPITRSSDKRPTRCTSTTAIVSGTASRPRGIKLVEQEWKQTEVSHVACAHYPLNNP